MRTHDNEASMSLFRHSDTFRQSKLADRTVGVPEGNEAAECKGGGDGERWDVEGAEVREAEGRGHGVADEGWKLRLVGVSSNDAGIGL